MRGQRRLRSGGVPLRSVRALDTLRKVFPHQPSVPTLNPGSTPPGRARSPHEQGKPLLLVDVDGVISLWGFDPDARPDGAYHAVDGLPHFLSSEAGRHLLDLAESFELVWCTGWEEKANEYLPRLLGLPGPMPWLSFDVETEAGATTPGHWKLAAIDAYARDRPAAWIDDAFNGACREWAARRAAPTLLVETEPSVGLVAAHADALRAWAADVTRSRPARLDA